jgi:hypothetical protein
MKKFFFLLMVAILLASCQAAPTPTLSISTPIPSTDIPVSTSTPADTEMLADSIYNVVGIWYAENGIFLDIKKGVGAADLTFSGYYTGQDPWWNFLKGTMKFENGKLTYLTVEGDCENAQQATYEIYVVKHDEHVIGIRPKVVGDDLCTTRKDTLDNKILEYVGILFFTSKK